MAFGAHPDDVELFAGGTLAKLRAQGYATGITDMTRGEMGTRGTPRLRAREARSAARILDLKVRENLGLPDSGIDTTLAARMKVIRIIRRYRPTLVLVHHWDDKHPDHVNTSRLVTEAAHQAGLEKIKTGQERFRPHAILYYMLPAHSAPTLVVDVSDYDEQRLGAIRSYKSQLFDAASRAPETYLSQPDFIHHVETIHSYYGTLIGKRKGEGFLVKGVIEVEDLVGFVRTQKHTRLR